MNTPETELPRRTNWGRLAVGCLVAAGIALAAGSPAMADNWKNGHGHKHWKHHHKQHYSYYDGYYYQPQVVYVRPRPVYVQPAPIYVAPPPPVYYYEPYQRPSVNIVFPIEID